jgi:hypothetical protein
VWDAPASGSNTNVASVSFPHPYTKAELFALLGCTDKETCAGAMIVAPDLGWAVKARAFLWQGYGK